MYTASSCGAPFDSAHTLNARGRDPHLIAVFWFLLHIHFSSWLPHRISRSIFQHFHTRDATISFIYYYNDYRLSIECVLKTARIYKCTMCETNRNDTRSSRAPVDDRPHKLHLYDRLPGVFYELHAFLEFRAACRHHCRTATTSSSRCRTATIAFMLTQKGVVRVYIYIYIYPQVLHS